MSQSRKSSKISTNSSESLEQNPFAALSASGLPAGELRPEPVKKEKAAKSKGRVEVRREKAGRGGKTVTTLKEFPTHIPLSELDALTKDLKKAFACGGVLKGRVVELQGDVCDRAIEALSARGYKPVKAGG